MLGLETGSVSFENIDDLFDIMTCDYYNGFPLPNGFTYDLWY